MLLKRSASDLCSLLGQLCYDRQSCETWGKIGRREHLYVLMKAPILYADGQANMTELSASWI